jgi:hypothetical protein
MQESDLTQVARRLSLIHFRKRDFKSIEFKSLYEGDDCYARLHFKDDLWQLELVEDLPGCMHACQFWEEIPFGDLKYIVDLEWVASELDYIIGEISSFYTDASKMLEQDHQFLAGR